MTPRNGVMRVGAGLALLAILTALACWNSGTYPPLERQRIGYSNHTAFFPIDTGAIHSRPDCETCHGGTATFLDFSCIRCHDHAQAHTDSIHAGVSGYAYDSTSCYVCHPNGTAAGVDHSPFFPIGAGTKHDLLCADCHPDFHNHLVFTCLSCHRHASAHTDSTHVGVAAYRYESPSCLGCHPRAEVITRDQHTPFFPIAAGSHGATLCGDCHQSAGNYRVFTCISCHDHAQAHTDSTHAGVPGYAYDSPSCLSCHPLGTVMTRAQHVTLFPIETGNHALACGECHTTPRDFTKFECILCHEHTCDLMDPRHTQAGGYSCVSGECYRCHPQGISVTRDAHTSLFPILTGAHASATCSDCHEVGSDYRVFTCISCHDHDSQTMDPAHVGVPGYTYDSPSCLACHPLGTAMTRAQHDPLFPIQSGNHFLACGDCHTTPRDYRKFECILCHSHTCDIADPQHTEVGGYSCVSSECYRCHPRGSSGG